MGARPGEFAAAHDQVFGTDRAPFKPAFQYLADSGGERADAPDLSQEG